LKDVPHVTLLPPLDYLPLVHLMKKATLILTDSGGVQEEAPSFGIPVLVMRETTERPEGVAAGTLKLVGTETSHIVQEAKRLLGDESEYAKMSKASNPYGDGHTADRVNNATHVELFPLFRATLGRLNSRAQPPSISIPLSFRKRRPPAVTSGRFCEIWAITSVTIGGVMPLAPLRIAVAEILSRRRMRQG